MKSDISYLTPFESHLRLNKMTMLYHPHSTSMIYHYCAPSASMIQSLASSTSVRLPL